MDFMLIQNYLDKIPKLDELAALPEIQKMLNKYGRVMVEEKINKILDSRHLEISTAKNEKNVKDLDFSMAFYTEALTDFLKEERVQSINKIVNCLGTIYSEVLGAKIYSKDILRDFTEIYKGYNNLRYDLSDSKEIKLNEEIEKILKSYSGDEDYILFSNFSGAFYSILHTCYKDYKVISSVRESYSFEKNLDLNTLLENLNCTKKVVGNLNSISIDDYNKNYDENSFIVLSDFFGNSLEGLAKLKDNEIKELLSKERTVFLSDKFYLKNGNSELSSKGLELSKFINNKALVLADLSKSEDLPNCIVLAGSKSLIKKIKESVYSKMFYPSKEVETLFYLGIEKKISENKDNSYLKKVLTLDESKLKNRNIKFIKSLEKELEDSCDIGLIEGPYLKVEENVSYKDAYNRELIVITPKEVSAEEIEVKLRNSDPAVLCWINDGSLLINLQLVDERDNKILLETLTKAILK